MATVEVSNLNETKMSNTKASKKSRYPKSTQLDPLMDHEALQKEYLKSHEFSKLSPKSKKYKKVQLMKQIQKQEEEVMKHVTATYLKQFNATRIKVPFVQKKDFRSVNMYLKQNLEKRQKQINKSALVNQYHRAPQSCEQTKQSFMPHNQKLA